MSNQTIRTWLFGSVAVASLAATATPLAVAQEDTSEKQKDRALVIDTVTVTAQKREESLQSVPVTVTAFSGPALEDKGINGLQSLSDATPGLTIDSFPKTTPRPFIRGIGSSNQSAGGDGSSVAFQDGVYLSRPSMLSVDIFDVERVEVLKGPQGTLWGKNVVGGAINFITKKPEDVFGFKLRATAAEYGQKDLSVMVNTPVSDRLQTRLALSSIKNDGFRTNLNTGGPLDDDERLSGRFHALYAISDDTDLLFSIDGTKDNVAGPARFNLAPNGFDDLDDPDTANPDRPGYIDRETWGTKLELNSSALAWADLTSYVSYRGLDEASSEDFDGTTPAGNAAAGFPLTGLQVLKMEEASSFTTEWRLASTYDSPLSWVTGVFYLHDVIDRQRESETSSPNDTSEDRYIAKNTTDSFAVFGEGRYAFTDAWSGFAGLRYTDESKEYEVRRLVGDPDDPTTDFTTFGNPGTTDEQQWTWRVGTDYQVSNGLFLFASVANGFKSGAFEEQPGEELARVASDPEKVLNYEVGAKSDFWNGRGRANISAFYADYSDLQTIKLVDDATLGPGGTRIVVDTGDATIKGVETEFQLLPVEGLQLTARYTYLDPAFDQLFETEEILADGTVVVTDLSGNQLGRSAKHAATFSMSYDTPEYDWGWLTFGVDANYQSEVFDENDNASLERRRPRTLLDAFLKYNINERTSVEFWGRNLTDEAYRIHQSGVVNGVFVQYGAPRQLGLTFSVSY